MPTYEYECANGHVTDDIKRIADRKIPIKCPTCGKTAVQIMSCPRHGLVDMREETAHYDMQLGEVVTGKRDFREKCKRNGFSWTDKQLSVQEV